MLRDEMPFVTLIVYAVTSGENTEEEVLRPAVLRVTTFVPVVARILSV
jgi:hypothetical protein